MLLSKPPLDRTQRGLSNEKSKGNPDSPHGFLQSMPHTDAKHFEKVDDLLSAAPYESLGALRVSKSIALAWSTFTHRSISATVNR